MIVALQALFFATPFILAGVGHILVIKLDLLKPLARIPLDGGTMLRGRPVFGRNKTLRGATIMIIGTSLWTLLAAHVAQRFPIVAKLSVLDYEQIPPIIWGMLLGLGCVLGELPNSFLKRQLDINPGEQPNNRLLKPLFWILDQLDSLIGVLVIASFSWKPSVPMIIALLIVTVVVHPLGAKAMVGLGLKKSIA